jgi:hypothetical protein
MEEDFRLSVEADVEVLARLEERTRDCAAWWLPAEPEERRAELILEPDAAVCAMRLGGSLTGFVGDLGLGLTKPMPEVKLLEGET